MRKEGVNRIVQVTSHQTGPCFLLSALCPPTWILHIPLLGIMAAQDQLGHGTDMWQDMVASGPGRVWVLKTSLFLLLTGAGMSCHFGKSCPLGSFTPWENLVQMWFVFTSQHLGLGRPLGPVAIVPTRYSCFLPASLVQRHLCLTLICYKE